MLEQRFFTNEFAVDSDRSIFFIVHQICDHRALHSSRNIAREKDHITRAQFSRSGRADRAKEGDLIHRQIIPRSTDRFPTFRDVPPHPASVG